MQDKTNAGTKENYKLYVEVGVIYTPGGDMEPKYLRLTSTGEKYMIDRIYVSGKDAKLFYEDSPDKCRWFVESRTPVREMDTAVQ